MTAEQLKVEFEKILMLDMIGQPAAISLRLFSDLAREAKQEKISDNVLLEVFFSDKILEYLGICNENGVTRRYIAYFNAIPDFLKESTLT